jgi:choline-sulfatase
VNLVDLYPTFLDAIGLPLTAAERSLPGRSLFEIAAAADDPERIAFSEYHAVGAPTGAFMLARGRYKYHYYVGYRPELFDIATDPEETSNLAEEPTCRDVVAEFEAELRKMLDPETVDCRAKDAQNALIARHGGRDAALKLGYSGETPTSDKFHGA